MAMPAEQPVLSSTMARIRAEIEDVLLARPHVSFVSVGFVAADPRAVLVSIGTARPDLLQVSAREIVSAALSVLYAHEPERAWNPDIHILKGRVRENVLTPA